MVEESQRRGVNYNNTTDRVFFFAVTKSVGYYCTGWGNEHCRTSVPKLYAPDRVTAYARCVHPLHSAALPGVVHFGVCCGFDSVTTSVGFAAFLARGLFMACFLFFGKKNSKRFRQSRMHAPPTTSPVKLPVSQGLETQGRLALCPLPVPIPKTARGGTSKASSLC